MVSMQQLLLRILLVFLSISSVSSAEKDDSSIKTCKADHGKYKYTISGWDWEVRNSKNESFFINICGRAKNCDESVSVCKSTAQSGTLNYGSSFAKEKSLPTTRYGETFSITFNGTVESKAGCANKTIQTKINFQCDHLLGSPELIDENGCMIIIDFFTKEACKSKPEAPKIAEIPCVIYNPVDKKKRDLSPLTKRSGGHRVSSSDRNVDIFINVCRDITPDKAIPEHACHDAAKGTNSPACRADIKKPIGKISEKETALVYEGDKIKLVYHYTPKTKSKTCLNGVQTVITFLCQKQFSNGGTGPVLVTKTSQETCKYDIIWRTDHACANNDVITDKCQFSNGEVSFDLTKLEKPNKQLSYQVKGNDNVEYRIKVCSNGQACGNDKDGSDTAVCQITTKKDSPPQTYSCGNADANHRSIRYADGKLTMVYRGGSFCHNNIQRRTIVTFRCNPAIGVGVPTFVEEQHCYYYFEWFTKHVCPSRVPGSCSIISDKNQTYDLSILTKGNGSWMAINDRKEAAGHTYYINVCGAIVYPRYEGCVGSAACEVKNNVGRGIGMFKSTPTISSSGTLSLEYIGGKCEGFKKNITTTIKFICKTKDLESPPELESRSWDGCDYVFTWSTAASCSLQVVNGEGCFLEDSVTGNVFDLSPLEKREKGQDYFTVDDKKTHDTYYIQMCSKKGLEKKVCGGREGAGICQKTEKSLFHIAGKIHDNLYYYDGVLKLKFASGDACSKNKKPSRESHITFFCDDTAGVGEPVFVGEDYCVYNFVWYTKYACPLQTMECAVKDDLGKEYDLSPLALAEDNWEVTNNGDTYYLSICRVLHRSKTLPKTCPVRSSACLKYANNTVAGIGHIVNQKSLTKDLVLRYGSGENGKYTTSIKFYCDKQGQIGSPVLTSASHGVYSFEWTTKYACGVKPRDESGCDDNDSRISMLKTPNKKGYTVHMPYGGKITFDICQNVTCGKTKTGGKNIFAAACLSNKGKFKSVGESAQSTIEHSDNVITLTYPGGYWYSTPNWARFATTKINFVCSRNVTNGEPVFLFREENVYVIEFKTSLACKAQAIECRDKNGQYNLAPLSLISGNWMAADTRSHLDYFINVCRDYYPGDSELVCSGSSGIGACQVDNRYKKSHNMGYIRSRPTVSSKGAVTLQYLGGETCHKTYKRSTRINFFCSDVHGSPVHMIETADCEYVFYWMTPSACPLKKYEAKNCIVYDDQYGFYFDLSSLKLQSQDLGGNIVYKVGFCDQTPDECGKGKASCFVKDGSVTNFVFKSMIYYDNKITITHDSSSLTIFNEISCDLNSKLISYVGKTSDGKSYHISWTSNLVCPPVVGEECSLTHEGILYDLSVLARENWNWIGRNAIKEFGFKDYQFYFSVCKPLKNIAGLKNNGSRAAMEDGKGTLTSLGTMIKPLQMSNGLLTMIYGHGGVPSQCKDSTSSQTTIQFVCDNVVPGGVGVGPVVDGFYEESCSFHVTWLTRAACPVRSLLESDPHVPCAAVHPATRKSISLISLKKSTGYHVEDQNNNKYLLNICGHPEIANSANCSLETSGICRISHDGKRTSVGNVSTALVYQQGFLYLHYKDGDNCEGQKDRKMETLITFMCDSKAGQGKPTLEQTNDCTHFVTWKTSLACEAEIDCVAHNSDHFYDLSPLIRNDANYEIKHKGRRYLINVCRSLVYDSRCSSNSSVCALPFGQRKSTNLGQLESAPVVSSGNDPEVKARLTYKTKSNCANPTTIDFVCSPDKRVEEPFITYADECSANIKWLTSLVCDKQEIYNNSCTFRDTKNTFCFDLKKLGWKDKISVKMPHGNAHFHVCGEPASNECKGATGKACLVLDGGLPKALSRTKISYNGNEVRISYGDDAVLLLYCGKDDTSNAPQYIGQKKNGNASKYFFSMVTPEVCPPSRLPCEIRHEKNVYNLAGLSERGGYLVKDGNHITYWVSFCGHIHFNTKTNFCSSRATAIKIPAEGKLQIITTDSNHSLTYHANQDYPIRLQYTSDEIFPDCGGDKKAKVLHRVKCKHVMKPPHFDGFDKKNCVFTFSWETYEACAENRAPLSQISGAWVFHNEKTSECELDLTNLRTQILKEKHAENCAFSKDVKVYNEGRDYELVVNCTRQDKTHKKRTIDVIIRCGNDTELITIGESHSYVTYLWITSHVCDVDRTGSCSPSVARSVSKSAVAVIGTLTGLGLLAAIIFFACKPEKRETVAFWLRWHIRRYICCKPSYQTSYRYKKVNTYDEDGETDFIIESGAGSLFSDSEDESGDSDENKDNTDDDLLPLDDDLLNLEE